MSRSSRLEAAIRWCQIVWFAVVLLAIIAFTSLAIGADQPIGTWRVLSIERYGELDVATEGDLKLEIQANGRFRLLSDDRVVMLGRIVFGKDGKSYDLSDEPLVHGDNATKLEAKDHFGIYDRKNDEMIMCASASKLTRPTRFSAAKNTDWELLRLRRVK